MNSGCVGGTRARRHPQFPLVLWVLLLLTRSSEEKKKRENTKDVIFDVCATCHANATCVQKDGKDICECNYGFTGNGRTICHEIDCGKPPWLPNADIIWDNSTTFGSTVYYKCKDGFQSFGEHNFSQCTISHKWENITFECKEIICGQPPVLSFSNMIWNGATHPGSTVEYNCMKGFYSTGTKSHSVCSRNGSWEMLDLRCKKVQDFVNVTWKDPCVSWKRYYGSTGVNETYQVTMLMLGNESKETTDMLIKPPATEIAVNVCLQLRQPANYTVEIIADSINLRLRVRIAHSVIRPVVVF